MASLHTLTGISTLFQAATSIWQVVSAEPFARCGVVGSFIVRVLASVSGFPTTCALFCRVSTTNDALTWTDFTARGELEAHVMDP